MNMLNLKLVVYTRTDNIGRFYFYTSLHIDKWDDEIIHDMYLKEGMSVSNIIPVSLNEDKICARDMNMLRHDVFNFYRNRPELPKYEKEEDEEW